MKRFCRDLLLFLAPLGVLLGVPLLVLARGREFDAVDVTDVAQRQARAPRETYFGPAYSDCKFSYKLNGVLARKPETLVLGTSRAMQYRSAFFRAPKAVFNAGGAVARIAHLRQLLAHLPAGSEPKLLLLTLDQEWFIRQWDPGAADDYERRVAKCITSLGVLQSSYAQVFRDFRDHKFGTQTLLSRRDDAVGLNALANGAGFRNDGSYYYAKVVAAPDAPDYYDHEFRDTLHRIETGTNRFEYADAPWERLTDAFAAFLDEARERGIHVVSSLSPYAPTVWGAMRASGRYTYVEKIGPLLSALHAARGHTFFDFSDPATVHAEDREFIDGYHPSERVVVRMLARIARADAAVGAHVDAEAILRMLEQAHRPLVVVPEE